MANLELGWHQDAPTFHAWFTDLVDTLVAPANGATSAAVRLAEKTFDPPFRVEEGKVVLLTVTNQGSVEGAFKGVLRGWDEPA